MRRGSGLTLVELLVVIALIALLMGIMLPSFAAGREQARRTSCAAQLHALQAALAAYSTENSQRLPPFMFSDFQGDLPQSGHFGGRKSGGFGTVGGEWVNLGALLYSKLVRPESLLCPSAPQAVLAGQASYFADTDRFSTYCLRMPPSKTLFNDAPNLANYDGSLLSVYQRMAGGQRVRIGGVYQQVPLVRYDRRYAVNVTGNKVWYDPAASAMLGDQFWRQSLSSPAAGKSRALEMSWCHGRRFNVAFGDGSVRTREDTGTVQETSLAADESPATTNDNMAVAAETIWQYFDGHN